MSEAIAKVIDEYYATKARDVIGSKLVALTGNLEIQEQLATLYTQIVPGNGRAIYDSAKSLSLQGGLVVLDQTRSLMWKLTGGCLLGGILLLGLGFFGEYKLRNYSTFKWLCPQMQFIGGISVFIGVILLLSPVS
jgi:hypothetical protein